MRIILDFKIDKILIAFLFSFFDYQNCFKIQSKKCCQIPTHFNISTH